MMDNNSKTKSQPSDNKSSKSGPEKSSNWSQSEKQKSEASFEQLFDSGYSATATSLVSPATEDSPTHPFHHFDTSSRPSLSTKSDSKFTHDDQKTNRPAIGDSGLCIDSGLSIQEEEDEDMRITSANSSSQVIKGVHNPPSGIRFSDPFVQDEDGDTLLHMAIVNETPTDIICNMICYAPHPDFLDIRNHLYQTPLLLAALKGQSCIVRRLILSGATIDMRDRFGNSALHVACEKGDLEVAKAIFRPFSPNELDDVRSLRYRVEGHSLSLLEVVHQMNYEGQTCIHLAAKSGNKKLLEYLLSCGADLNVREGKSGWSILHVAVADQNVVMVHCLLSTCHVDTSIRDYGGLTPLRLSQKINGNSHCISKWLGASDDSTLGSAEEDEDSDFSESDDEDAAGDVDIRE